MSRRIANHRAETSRRGAVLVAVVVGLTALLLLFGTMLKMTAVARQQQRHAWWQHQAMWLAESGLARGQARLAREPGYQGETWQIGADELPGEDAGVVHIRVEPLPGDFRRRRIRATASFPERAIERVEITLESDGN